MALAWFEKIFFGGNWDLSTNSKGKKSFIADEASFFVKKPFWFEFIGFFPMVRVPDQGGEVKKQRSLYDVEELVLYILPHDVVKH